MLLSPHWSVINHRLWLVLFQSARLLQSDYENRSAEFYQVCTVVLTPIYFIEKVSQEFHDNSPSFSPVFSSFSVLWVLVVTWPLVRSEEEDDRDAQEGKYVVICGCKISLKKIDFNRVNRIFVNNGWKEYWEFETGWKQNDRVLCSLLFSWVSLWTTK